MATDTNKRHEVKKDCWVRIGNRMVCPLAYCDGVFTFAEKPIRQSVRIRRKRRGFDKPGGNC